MNPTTFPEQTRVLKKPADMTDEECSPLGIHDTGDTLISCWKPTIEERERIARGEPVWLGVVGRGHPPVWLSTECPFPREATPGPAAPVPFPVHTKLHTDKLMFLGNLRGDVALTLRRFVYFDRAAILAPEDQDKGEKLVQAWYLLRDAIERSANGKCPAVVQLAKAATAEARCETCPHWKDTLEERRLDARTRRENAYAARTAGLPPGVDRPPPPRMDDLDRFPSGGDCTRMPETVFKRPDECCGEHPARRFALVHGQEFVVDGSSVEEKVRAAFGEPSDGVGQPS